MKRKLNKTKRFAAWLSKPEKAKKNIHDQIQETIAERNRILPEWERHFLADDLNAKKDIHVQLKETISAFKRSMKQHESFFMANQNNKAA